ncbi:hypothetical protein LCGC14_1678630 [marine sediment metagenome]|uniref:Uncharacterized protein n=1 Tax=marine sediment metagenome TaxID=412755 RepID=A0A0F9KP93_9ZZZZ
MRAKAKSNGRLKADRGCTWPVYAKKYNWEARAESYDARHLVAIEQRHDEGAEAMVNRHLEKLKNLFTKATDYLEQHDFHSMNDARKALKLAIDEERKALGLPTYLMGIMKLSDGDLLTKYNELIEELGRIRSGDEPERDITAKITDAEFTVESEPDTNY